MTDHVQLSPTDWVREQTEQILEQGTTDGVQIQDRPVVLFTVTGAKSVGDDIDVAALIDLCLAENERRMSLYDGRLLRPFAVPALARLARRFIRPTRARP